MKESYPNWKGRFFRIALFAIVMGFLEAIVVLFLGNLYYPDGISFPLRLISADLVTAEWVREVSTLMMLAGMGIIAGRNGLQRLFYALFESGGLCAKESPEAGERLTVMITTYVSDHYK